MTAKVLKEIEQLKVALHLLGFESDFKESLEAENVDQIDSWTLKFPRCRLDSVSMEVSVHK